MLVGYVQLLAWVYGLGLLAAAPVGPVNMVAIHRGVVGRWSHTLACGFGSALVDLGYFALFLWGGQRFLEYLSSPRTRDLVALACAVLLVPIGVLFLRRAVRMDDAGLHRIRQDKRDRPPIHLWTDMGTGMGLTLINPAAPAYWLAASAPWLASARHVMGGAAIGWGLAGASAGLMSWFILITLLVRFAPQRLGLRFFRVVHALCGLMLLGFASYCIWLVVSHLLRL